MARRRSSIPLRSSLRKLFPASLLREWSVQTGAVQRHRKVGIEALFWTVVLGFGTGRQRSIAGLRRAFEKATGRTLAPSSFYKRFRPEFTALLKLAVGRAVDSALTTSRRLEGPLSGFRDLVLADATVLRLHSLLEHRWPATRTNHTRAAAKLHVVLSVRGASCQAVKITSERAADGRVLRIGPWVSGRLLLFDLGYFRYQLFSCITRNGGFFLSRLKSNANPTIVAINRTHRGRAVDVVGQPLQDVLDRLQRDVLDVMVRVHFRRRRYRGQQSGAEQILRVVGVRDPRTGQRRLYVTNVAPEALRAEDVQAVYAARWEVELLFREWKQHYRLDELPSRKPEIVEALLYASILTLVVSRRLGELVRQRLGKRRDRLRAHRWAKIFEAVAQDLLLVVLRRPRDTVVIRGILQRFLLRESIDPNANRRSLIQAVEAREHQYRMAA